MSEKKRRGGWSNPASAANGRNSANSPTVGRPKVKAEFRRGEQLVIERIPLAPSPEHPFTKPELGIVLNVSADEVEIQIGDDILTIRRPDPDE